MIKKRKKKKIKWIKTLARPCSPIKMFSLMKGWASKYKKLFGKGFENQLIFPEDSQHILCYNKDEFEAFQKVISKKIKKNEKYIIESAKNCYKVCEEFVKISKKINFSNLDKKSNIQLKELFLEFNNKMMDYSIYLWVPLVIEKYLPETIQKRGKFDRKEFEIISTKIKLIPAEEEEINLLKIAVKLEEKKGKTDMYINKLIQNHTKKYCWLPTYDFNLPVLTEKDFLKRLEEIKNPMEKLKEKREKIEDSKKRIKKIKEKIKSKYLLKLIDALQEYLFLRTYRTDVLRQATYYALPFLWEIAKRAHISKEDVYLLTPNEIIDFLEKNKLPKLTEIKRRKKMYVLIRRNGKEEIISNPKEINKIGKGIETKKEITILTLEGNTTYPGIVKGRVAVITNIKDIKKLKRGNILVSSMTTPDMIVAFDKVAAIVTNEGGITSHAAISSRELKIPCVIATKNATSVLKDGDFIEVDANKGIVKILKKAK